jgi:hypothetical protein
MKIMDAPQHGIVQKLQNTADVIIVDMRDIDGIEPGPASGAAAPTCRQCRQRRSNKSAETSADAAVAQNALAVLAFEQEAIALVRLENRELHRGLLR